MPTYVEIWRHEALFHVLWFVLPGFLSRGLWTLGFSGGFTVYDQYRLPQWLHVRNPRTALLVPNS